MNVTKVFLTFSLISLYSTHAMELRSGNSTEQTEAISKQCADLYKRIENGDTSFKTLKKFVRSADRYIALVKPSSEPSYADIANGRGCLTLKKQRAHCISLAHENLARRNFTLDGSLKETIEYIATLQELFSKDSDDYREWAVKKLATALQLIDISKASNYEKIKNKIAHIESCHTECGLLPEQYWIQREALLLKAQYEELDANPEIEALERITKKMNLASRIASVVDDAEQKQWLECEAELNSILNIIKSEAKRMQLQQSYIETRRNHGLPADTRLGAMIILKELERDTYHPQDAQFSTISEHIEQLKIDRAIINPKQASQEYLLKAQQKLADKKAQLAERK